ncbi:hypothetical protein [uncultured Sphingomonas sp.]|uniref:hypothetical protein n=1 Tax=uncultured Sphingomonas sp. TaxID=158754 RepID=UPI00260A2F0D|nr:hypothetical protein [uncultured Sphingomonas sp.]
MFRKAILAAALLLASLPLVAAPAAAANLNIKDGNSTAQVLCAISMSDGSLSECNILTDTTGTKIDPATKQLQQSTITTLGSPFQAGGSIGNTSFGISGTLPAFAAPPTVNFGTLNGAATDATLQLIKTNTKPATSFGAVTVGTAFTPGIGLAAICTAAGNIVLNGSDGSAITVPVNIGFNQFGFGVAKVASQTATCTFTNLL